MFYLLYKHQWNTKPFHFNTEFFRCERRDLLCSHSKGDPFTCELDNVLFSHVKISSFRAKAHLVFHWWLYNKFYCSLEGFLLLLLRVYDDLTRPLPAKPSPIEGGVDHATRSGWAVCHFVFLQRRKPILKLGCHRQPINALYAFFFMRYWDFLCNSRIFANLVFKNLDGNVNWERYSDRYYLNMGEDSRYSTVADRIWTTDLPNTGRSSFEPSCGKMSYMRFISDIFHSKDHAAMLEAYPMVIIKNRW